MRHDSRYTRVSLHSPFFSDRFAHMLFLHAFHAPAIAHTLRPWNMVNETGNTKSDYQRENHELIYIDAGFLFDMRSLYFTIKLSTHQRDTPATLGRGSPYLHRLRCTAAAPHSLCRRRRRTREPYINLHIIILCLKWLRGSLYRLHATFFSLSQSEHAFRSVFFSAFVASFIVVVVVDVFYSFASTPWPVSAALSP